MKILTKRRSSRRRDKAFFSRVRERLFLRRRRNRKLCSREFLCRQVIRSLVMDSFDDPDLTAREWHALRAEILFAKLTQDRSFSSPNTRRRKEQG